MFATNLKENSNGKGKQMRLLAILLLTVVAVFFTMGKTALAEKSNFCTRTAISAYKACLNEILDDLNIARGNCFNVSDDEEREDCFNDAKFGEDGYKAAKEECKDQFRARRDVCEDLGENRYDPELVPSDFVDPDSIASDNANRYFPLVVGNQWVYEGETEDGKETITVRVLDETKEIEYPEGSGNVFTCRVVNDVVELTASGEEDPVVIEDTDDWYAQDLEGNVWYFGEIARNYEDGELVDIEGSWKAGVDGAKPGILMWGYPSPADEPDFEPPQEVYRQEFALGDAEDLAEVISRGEESKTVPVGGGTTYDEDVLQTKDFTPIEPDVFEYKYYAPGIGLILEEAYEDEDDEPTEKVELISYSLN